MFKAEFFLQLRCYLFLAGGRQQHYATQAFIQAILRFTDFGVTTFITTVFYAVNGLFICPPVSSVGLANRLCRSIAMPQHAFPS